ncbi:MAG: SMR family transporter [Candidatus Paceibacterota bacterium]
MIYLFFGGIILTIGDIFFKYWTKNPKISFYIIGIIIYLVGLMFLVQSFKTQNIAVASAIFVIINIITLGIVSWIFFKEPLSITQIIGIILALIAIFILEFK